MNHLTDFISARIDQSIPPQVTPATSDSEGENTLLQNQTIHTDQTLPEIEIDVDLVDMQEHDREFEEILRSGLSEIASFTDSTNVESHPVVTNGQVKSESGRFVADGDTPKKTRGNNKGRGYYSLREFSLPPHIGTPPKPTTTTAQAEDEEPFVTELPTRKRRSPSEVGVSSRVTRTKKSKKTPVAVLKTEDPNLGFKADGSSYKTKLHDRSKGLSMTPSAVDYWERNRAAAAYLERIPQLVDDDIITEVDNEGWNTPIGRAFKATVRQIERCNATRNEVLHAAVPLPPPTDQMLAAKAEIERLTKQNQLLRDQVAQGDMLRHVLKSFLEQPSKVR